MFIPARTRATWYGQLVPDYVCQREGIEHGEPICQHIPGAAIDEAVGDILVEAVTPITLEVALAVQQELQSRLEEADRLRQQQVERARDEAELRGAAIFAFIRITAWWPIP